MAGGGELFAATHAAGFDEDDVAADGRPDKADGNAGLFGAFVDFTLGTEFRHAEEFANDFRCDNHFFRFTFGDTPRLLARDSADFAFEIANTGFAREAVDDLLQAGIGELNVLADF